MSKANATDEVTVLRLFEESPIEKAEILFNIVKVKMQERLAPNDDSGIPEGSSPALATVLR